MIYEITINNWIETKIWKYKIYIIKYILEYICSYKKIGNLAKKWEKLQKKYGIFEKKILEFKPAPIIIFPKIYIRVYMFLQKNKQL